MNENTVKLIECKCPKCLNVSKLQGTQIGRKVSCTACGAAFMMLDLTGYTVPVDDGKKQKKAVVIPARKTSVRASPSMTAARSEGNGGKSALVFVGLTCVLLVGLFFFLRSSSLKNHPKSVPPAGSMSTAELDVDVPPPESGKAVTKKKPAGIDQANPGEVANDEGIPLPPGNPPVVETVKKPEVGFGYLEEGVRDAIAASVVDDGSGSTTPDIISKYNPDRLEKFLKLLKSEKFKLNKPVRDAYFALQKDKMLSDLNAMGKELPQEFLDWIDKDSQVRASVYASKPNPVNVALMLYSLQLDVGKDVVHKCPQLALSAAILNEKKGPSADITKRQPMKLVMPEFKLKPVDTRDKKRELDVNDHIINFLNEDYKTCKLRDDIKKPKTVHHEKDTCMNAFDFSKLNKAYWKPAGLIATDVIKDDDLKDLLSDYLKSKGTPLEIPHGKLQSEATYVNYEIFNKAYVEKGLTPPDRDPPPSTSERLLYLAGISDRSPFPLKKAPWPIMMLLFEVAMPLNECDEIWTEYKKKGRFIGYGNYVGPIAQNAIWLAASDLRPFPYSCHNRSWQVMIKNGGVCGTMAMIAVGTHNALGTPAQTAGQPGHCALISYTPSGRGWVCNIEQSVSGGPKETFVFADWPYGDGKYRGNLQYWRDSIASAMTVGFDEYLDSCIYYNIFRITQAASTNGSSQTAAEMYPVNGFDILREGIEANPYNIMLTSTLSEIGTPIQIADCFKSILIRTRANRATNGKGVLPAYQDYVAHIALNRVASQPVAKKDEEIKEVHKFLRTLSFDEKDPVEVDVLWTREKTELAYYAAMLKEKQFLVVMLNEFGSHFESTKAKYPTLCQKTARRIKFVAEWIQDEVKRREWLEMLAKKSHGKEDYAAFGRINVDIDHKDTKKPLNYLPGPGQLVMNDSEGPLKVHFVLGSGTDDYETIRDLVNEGAPPTEVVKARNPFMRAVLRDEAANAVAELLGTTNKPLQGVSAILTGDALKDKKEAAAAFEFLDKTRFNPNQFIDAELPKRNSTLLLQYEIAAIGVDKFLTQEVDEFKKYARPTGRDPLESRDMGKRINAIAGVVSDEEKKTAWLEKMKNAVKGQETFKSRKCFITKDEKGNDIPPEKQVELTSCPIRTYDDEAAIAINTLLGIDTEALAAADKKPIPKTATLSKDKIKEKERAKREEEKRK